MKIYDISKELFSAAVYPGDPIPYAETILSLDKNPQDICQLSKIIMGSHSGTHLDAPRHFIKTGNDVAQIPLSKCIGKCRVVLCEGNIRREQVDMWIKDGINKILFAGNVVIDTAMAKYIVDCGIDCIGVEMSTVALGEDQIRVHKILLEAGVVIVEGLLLRGIEEGIYFLSALPLKMKGMDGSPIRAVLFEL